MATECLILKTIPTQSKSRKLILEDHQVVEQREHLQQQVMRIILWISCPTQIMVVTMEVTTEATTTTEGIMMLLPKEATKPAVTKKVHTFTKQ